ncbi:hypothetical protein NMY22_g19998 [Coprinellus aureogranulatus]|nr:hypothetical protein NMY22_g19998 [Coprinellus aureogranulatus]
MKTSQNAEQGFHREAVREQRQEPREADGAQINSEFNEYPDPAGFRTARTGQKKYTTIAGEPLTCCTQSTASGSNNKGRMEDEPRGAGRKPVDAHMEDATGKASPEGAQENA